MTAAADRFPEWIRRKMRESSSEGARESTGGRLDTEPVVVWEALNTMEAQIVKGRLESEGIPAIIRSESLGQIYGLTMGGLARADVLVPAPLADRAVEILSAETSEAGNDTDAPDSAAF